MSIVKAKPPLPSHTLSIEVVLTGNTNRYQNARCVLKSLVWVSQNKYIGRQGLLKRNIDKMLEMLQDPLFFF